MNIKKTILGNIDKVYAVLIAGKDKYIGASEGTSGAYLFSGGEIKPLWENIGGTMNVVPIGSTNNKFVATTQFLPVFDAKECTLNYVEETKGGFSVSEICKFPYLHRFDVFTVGNEYYFIGATLCGSKDFVQDWSSAGSVYVGKFSKDFKKLEEVKILYTGITKNHGMNRCDDKYYVSGVEGVFCFEIPNNPIEVNDWKIQNVLPVEVSDIAFCDVNQDGELEMATIEGFHGDKFYIYKKILGNFVRVYERNISFGHVVWGGKVASQDGFILGYRKDDMKLLKISFDGKTFVEELIDEYVGSSQISVASCNDKTILLSANRQINELAVYEIS